MVLALVQPGEVGDLSPDRLEAVTHLLVDWLLCRIECFVPGADRDLCGYDPRMQRTPNRPQVTQGFARTHAPAGHSDQSQHLALERVSIRQVERILQDTAHAAVDLGRPEDNPVGSANVAEKALDGVPTRRLLV